MFFAILITLIGFLSVVIMSGVVCMIKLNFIPPHDPTGRLALIGEKVIQWLGLPMDSHPQDVVKALQRLAAKR